MAVKSVLDHRQVKHEHCGVCGACLLSRRDREVKDGLGNVIGRAVSPHVCPGPLAREVLEVMLLEMLPWERRGGQERVS